MYSGQSIVRHHPLFPASRKKLNDTGLEDVTAFRFAVTPLALLLVAYPTVATLLPSYANTIYVGSMLALVPLVLYRLDRVTRPAVLLLVLIVIYAMSSAFAESPGYGFGAQGVRNTVTLAFIGSAFLFFAAYGKTLLSLRGFPLVVVAVAVVDLFVIYSSGFSKNKTAATLLYVSAIAIIALISRTKASGWIAAFAFALLGASLALWYDVRFMIFCSIIFIVMFAAATRLRMTAYRILGILLSITVIPLVIWFFLNIGGQGIAGQFARVIAEWSGRRAESGRDVLFPYLLYATEESQLFGLGAGTLPRDIISTGFSAHNYYIQLYLQLGLLGLAVLVTFLLSVWSSLSRTGSAAGRFGSALFIMFLMHNATEVIMFQNAAVMAVPAWSAIGIALAIDSHAKQPEFTKRAGNSEIDSQLN